MEKILIVGAGIVGLATAYKLLEAEPGLKITIIEKEKDVCKHQTGNNSGVIHSGIYYKPGSLKAQNCRKGYQKMIDFCDINGIEYDLCGKIIVAVDEKEIPYLNNLYERGIANGLDGMKKLDSAQLKDYEPNVNGVAGILVPQTGIIDYKQVGKKLKELLIEKGVEFKFGEAVKRIKSKSESKSKIIEVGTEKCNYSGDFVISCAGLHSDRIARMTNPNLNVRIIPFRGEYYKISEERKNLVKNLIYPVPDPAFPFLGVHFTRMIDGKVEAGPNAVLAFKREGYKKTDINIPDSIETFAWPGFRKVMYKYWRTGLGEFHRSFSKKAFVIALQRLLPAIKEDDLVPGGAGIRAQACDKYGGLVDDFLFEEQENVLHVLNAPSPAATSSLAIGEEIAKRVRERSKK